MSKIAICEHKKQLSLTIDLPEPKHALSKATSNSGPAAAFIIGDESVHFPQSWPQLPPSLLPSFPTASLTQIHLQIHTESPRPRERGRAWDEDTGGRSPCKNLEPSSRDCNAREGGDTARKLQVGAKRRQRRLKIGKVKEKPSYL